ncbi:MAG: hypothetical protein J6N51_06190, partial [Selenomonas sp.]|nr:hypothetical protein [Selenomonas sp.]
SDFGTVQKNSFGITWSQHLSGIWVVADSIIPRTGAILLSRKALYPIRCKYFQEISLIFVVGKLSMVRIPSLLSNRKAHSSLDKMNPVIIYILHTL